MSNGEPSFVLKEAGVDILTARQGHIQLQIRGGGGSTIREWKISLEIIIKIYYISYVMSLFSLKYYIGKY